jgi:hypothetical protein
MPRVDTMARKLVKRREAYDKAAARAKKLEKEFKDTQADFWEHMDDEGLTTLTVDLGPGIGKVQFQKRETIRGIVKDPTKAVESLKAMGLADALLGDPRIHQRALSESVRDWLASGQKIPDGLDFNPTRYVSQTRKDK